MKHLASLAVIVFALTTNMSSAQTQQPYAGFETRPIKALSDEQLADLRAGHGMGLALAAELNGYPGPSHVLELAEPLGLTEAQKAKMREFFAAMKAETVPIGEKLIAQETDLNRQFADKTITEAKLVAAMQAIGSAQAALRAAHLKYHLATAALLAPMQIQRYAELRGYSSGQQIMHPPGGHRH
jgi:Spy/CpxP family protein refolding chaperone